MKKASRWLLTLLIVSCMLLSSCSSKETADELSVKIEVPEIRSLEDSIWGMQFGVAYSYYITPEFLKEYPYKEGYWRHHYGTCHYFYWEQVASIGSLKINKPVYDLRVDERLLIHLQYDKETYPKAKSYLAELFELSDTCVQEYNGYVFYGNFQDDFRGSPNDFDWFAYNDSNNTIIILALFYTDVEEIDLVNGDYEWSEILEMFFGGWYDFSV